MRPHPFERVFAPRAVAVLGAPGPVLERVLDSLLGGGFAGPLYAVGGAAVARPGLRTCPTLADVPGEVDLAVLAAPAEDLPALVRACAERRVGGALLTAGADGRAHGALDGPTAARVLAEAARGRLRLIGPGSVGLLRTGVGLNATFTRGRASPGPIGLVSQSGAICATALDWAAANGVGFSTVVALGEALDVDLGEVLEYLALDPSTGSVLVYVERIRSARAFLSGLRLAARLKPVLVVKAGRPGGPAADAAFDAALARTGAVRVASIERMFAAARLLARPRPVGGSRLAILTNARAPGQLAADRAVELGLSVPPLAAPTLEALGALLPGKEIGNPVDLRGDADAARYGAAVRACLADPGVDGVLAMLAPQALAQPLESAEAVAAESRRQAKPLLACWMGAEAVRGAHARFLEEGIPALPAPEAAVEAFGLLAAYARNQRLLHQLPGPLAPDAVPQVERARDLVTCALARGRGVLTTHEVHRLLGAFGVCWSPDDGRRALGAEFHLVVSRDEVFGPVIRLGRAGDPADVVVALPPLDGAIIRTLVQASPAAPLFAAPGGLAPADVAAFERTLWALSTLLAEVPELVALEIERLAVAGGEAHAPGGRVAVGPRPPGAGRYDHMAIHPYPADIGARWTLPGGVVVKVRPIRPEDAEMEQSFVRHLSANSRHFRFMSGLKELTREMLVRFTQIDYDRELALLALVERDGEETEIGVARYTRTDAASAQLAVVVADEWQGRGIGRRLLETIIEAARARGVTRLEAELLADNLPIRALLGRLGFTFQRDRDELELLLAERTLAPAG